MFLTKIERFVLRFIQTIAAVLTYVVLTAARPTFFAPDLASAIVYTLVVGVVVMFIDLVSCFWPNEYAERSTEAGSAFITVLPAAQKAKLDMFNLASSLMVGGFSL